MSEGILWGFNLDNRKYAIKIIGWFIIVLSVIELVIWMIIYINKGNIQQLSISLFYISL